MKLVLRTTCKEGQHPLYTRMSVENAARWIDLRINVDVVEWEAVSKSERKLSNFLNKKGISKKIALIEDAIVDMRRHHRLTMENLNETIENIVLADVREKWKRTEELKKEIEKKKGAEVKKFVIEYVAQMERGDARTSQKEKFSKGSCKNWKQFRRVFLDFCNHYPFGWDDICESLVDRYISYLEEIGYMKYTINKQLSMFKTIVGIAERHGLHTNHCAGNLFKGQQIKEEDKTKKIYLTKEELSALYDMPLDGYYEQVRDVFLVGCFTAMRFSDYGRIDKSNIGFTHRGTKVIRVTQEKTRGTVVIPILDDRLETILKKYDYNVPDLWGESLNRAIKEICKKLSETVPSLRKKERTRLTLKERRSEENARKDGISLYEYDEQGYPVKPRWKLVSSHTARRSCITNMYLSRKFTVQQMMSISGHKDEATFYSYVKLSLDEFADNLADIASDGLF